MAVLDEAQKLSRAGRAREAIELVERAALAGDCEAIFAMANWRIFGLNGPRDLEAAHGLLDRAGALGHMEAIRLRATLIGNGTGCPADPDRAARMLRSIRDVDPYAALQLDLAEKMPTPEQTDLLPVETLSGTPLIRCIRKLLTPEECGYLIALAEPELQPSFVIHAETGRRIPHPVRTSSGMNFGPTKEDRVVNFLNRRLAQVTGTDVASGEPLHVLRYAPGEEYRPHVDALPAAGNQRDWTVLVYLNEDYGGGSTRFDLVGVEFAGRTGDALIFRNVDEGGRADPATRHAGLPVTSGAKWLASRWVRRRRHDPWEA